MIVVIGSVLNSKDKLIGYKVLDVSAGSTKLTPISGVIANINIIDNIHMIDGNIACTDTYISQLPKLSSNDELLSEDKLIIICKDGDNYICTSAKGKVSTLNLDTIMKLSGSFAIANAKVDGNELKPIVGSEFRQVRKYIELNISDVKESGNIEGRVHSAIESFRPIMRGSKKLYEMTPEERERLNKLAVDCLATLNSQQRQAATAIDGNVRLIAGAGTGKTNTLTKRIACIIGSGVNPDRILSVTFTNKAAAEMRERASKLLDIDEKYLRLQTFHSLCNDILRQSIHVIGWKSSFSLGGVGAFKEMVLDIMTNDPDYRSIDSREITYIKKKILDKNNEIRKTNDCSYAEYLIDKPLPYIDNLKTVIQYELDRDKQVEMGLWDNKKDKNSPLNNYVAHIFAYQRRISYLSFDDLIALTLLIFLRYSNVLQYWQNRFDFIQVDEFQDTNPMQFELVKLLSDVKQNLFVVGDPDQSIYAFRNAAPEILINLHEKLTNVKDIIMDINYRSTEEILTVGNEVIKLCKNRIPKDLRIGTEKQHGVKAKVIFEDNGDKVAEKIVRNIKNFISEGVPLEEIAILYRSKMSESLSKVAESLSIAKIPFRVYGNSSMEKLGEYDFLVNLFDAILNRDNPYHIMKSLKYVRGMRLTKKTKDAFKSSDDCIQTFKDMYNSRQLSVESYLSLDKIYEFIEEIEDMQASSTDGNIDSMSIREVSDMILTVFTEESSDIVSKIYEKISEYKAEAKNSGEVFDVAYLVSQLALVEDTESEDKDKCVQIMTIHKSKGLEFNIVFVLNINTNNFPGKQTNNIDEEVRLAYVAYTRARNQLYLTCNCSQGWYGQSVPSMFVAGLDKNNLLMSRTAELKWQSIRLEAIRNFKLLS